MVLSTFSCICFGICVWFLRKKTVYSDILPIFNWVICVFFLCYWIIDFLIWSAINDLLDIWCANIFFHSVGWLFVFCFFLCRNFSVLRRFTYCYFSCLRFWCHIQKIVIASTISRIFSSAFFLDVLQLNVYI